MDILGTLLIAFALAMDSFTVSISGGATLKHPKLKDALIVGIYFGLFQFIMPLIGWKGGHLFSNCIDSFDHWIALGLLTIIGGKMIIDSFRNDTRKSFSISHKLLLMLAIATSIDALGVGLSYAFLDKPILIPSIIIGTIALIFSFIGIYLGKLLKKLLKSKAELIGGIILIGIGIKIAIEHKAFNFLL